MSLTAAEETFIKKEKKKADLMANIKTLNDTAAAAMNIKRDEIVSIQSQLTTDVKAKQDQIDAL